MVDMRDASRIESAPEFKQLIAQYANKIIKFGGRWSEAVREKTMNLT